MVDEFNSIFYFNSISFFPQKKKVRLPSCGFFLTLCEDLKLPFVSVVFRPFLMLLLRSGLQIRKAQEKLLNLFCNF